MTESDLTWAVADRPTPRIWNTQTVPGAEAFDFYREGICAAFMPLRPELARGNRAGFKADLASYDLGDSVLNLVTARAHTVLRRRAEIAASPQDCYYLNYQIGGQCRIRQNGAEITLGAGDVGIFDSGDAFDLLHDRMPELRVASLMVPKALLADHLPAGQPLLLSRHPLLGPLIAEAARSLAEAAAWASTADLERLHGVLLSLAALCTAQPQAALAADTRRAAQLARIKAILRRHAGHPGYGATDCAAAAGISPRHLHRLFAQAGESFAAALLQARLQRAARLLGDPAQAHLPVGSIGYAAGFSDPSHFSRCFRQSFGHSPGAWRKARLAPH